MTSVRCVECSALGLKASPAMARQGFGQCQKTPELGKFVSVVWARDCAKFSPVKPDLLAKRRQFFKLTEGEAVCA